MTDQQILLGIIVALLALIGTLITVSATRGKTRADAKTAMDQRIDERVSKQLEGAWSRIDELEKDQKAMQQHSDVQDRALRDLERREAEKSNLFRRIFAQIAELLQVRPQIDLTTTEIELVGDTLPPDWLSNYRKENPR